jgi:hypothetical protein
MELIAKIFKINVLIVINLTHKPGKIAFFMMKYLNGWWNRMIIFLHDKRYLLLIILFSIILTFATPSLAATNQIHIVKYAGDGATILAEKTITYQEMEKSLPVLGDGSTHYYHQGPVFIDDPDPVTQERLRWNPREDTNAYPEKDMGAVKGTDLKDLCNLVGGMSSGDTVKIKASDGFTKEFVYKNVYTPPPRQGPMVITWYKDGQYPDSGYDDGMKLVFFADTSVNPWGAHVFGNFDWHESADQQYWYYYQSGDQKYPTTTGLSAKYVSDILIYSSLTASGISGSWGWNTGSSKQAGGAPADDAIRYGYTGSKLTTYSSGIVNGSVRLIDDPNSTPVDVNNRIREYSLPVDLPAGANLTLARLYVYVSKSHGIQSGPGVMPSMYTCFNRIRIEPEKVYIDTDGDDRRNVSATFAYDVLDNLRGNGTYSVSLGNLDYDQYVFSVDDVKLLVVYEQENGTSSQYWINEGCDVIFSQPEKGIFPKDATTSIVFGGAVNITETNGADLIVLSTNHDAVNSTEHAMKFNNGTWYNPFDNSNRSNILSIPVTHFLNASGNSAIIESTIRKMYSDYLINRNAILVIEHNRGKGSDSKRDVTNLTPDQSIVVNASFLLNTTPKQNSTPVCKLSLHSDPEGALIYVDGIYQGKTTPSIFEMNSSDQRNIRLELDGFVAVERDLKVTNDTTVCEQLYSDVYSTKWRSDELVPDRDKTHNGGLFINSRPKPALISLNGVQLSQRTPAVISGLKEGTYTVRLSFEQADPFIREKSEIKFQDQEVYVHPFCIGPVDVSANTSPLYEKIIDSRNLRGEQFTVNGRINRKSIPDTITAPLFDSFITVFHNMSYVSYSLPATLYDNHYHIIQPRKYIELNVFVDSRPQGAEVFIDGFRTGLSTPYLFSNISDGPHRIMVSKPGYIPQESLIDLPYTPAAPVSATNISFVLQEYPSGFLRVTSNPAGAAITLDGTDTGEVTPFIFSSIPIGLHSVEVTINNTSRKFPEITVNAVEVTKVNAFFTEI